jgi:hypothetical protein
MADAIGSNAVRFFFKERESVMRGRRLGLGFRV